MRERHYHHHHHHYNDRAGYARRAGSPGPGPNRHHLYKDKRSGIIAGVCAGIANYYGWRADWLRIGWAIAALFFFPFPVIAYVIAAFVMKPAPALARYETREEEEFWRTFTTRPKVTFSELKHRFRALDGRVADLESAVISDEFGLRKAFRDLERGA